MTKHILLSAIGLLFNFFSNAQCTVQGIFIHSFLADPTGTNNFDTDGDSSFSARDEFIQICNGSSSTVQLNGFTLSDIVGVKYSFSSTDSILAGECITVISDWQNTASMPIYFRERDASSVWNDSGDSILLSDGTNTCNVSYGSHGSTAEQDGCPTVFANGTAYVDCGLSSTDITTSPLPVELVYFGVRQLNSKNILEWHTASEVDNSHFNIERSSDAKDFFTIGTIEGQGNSKELIHYLFEDYTASNLSYYRLKQLDYNGTFNYSSVIKLKKKFESITFLNSAETLNIYSNNESTSHYQLFDISGTIISEASFLDSVLINKSNLQRGIYYIEIYSNGRSVSRKIAIF